MSKFCYSLSQAQEQARAKLDKAHIIDLDKQMQQILHYTILVPIDKLG